LYKFPNLFKVINIFLPLLLLPSIYWFYSEKEDKEVILPEMTVQEKKERFNSLVVPVVIEVYADLMKQYQEVSESIRSGDDNDKIKALRVEYRVSNNEELLMALKPHPKSIALAQAVMESSWATSRFFVKAKNLFGVWSFNKNEPRIKAGRMRGDTIVWLKKYPSIKASIRDYYRTLGRGHAYDEFRKLKMETSDPYELVKKLDRYSENGDEYIEQLTSIIQYNEFYIYDQQDTKKP